MLRIPSRIDRIVSLLSLSLPLVAVMVAAGTPAWARDRWVPDEYPTPQAAIDAADPGDTVRIRIGRYAGPPTFKDGIALQGEGADKPVIYCAVDDAPALSAVDCASGSVRNIAFRHTGATAEKSDSESALPVVHLLRSNVEIRHCDVRGAAASGILVEGPCSPTIAGSTARGNWRHGISVKGPEAAPVLEDNACLGNGLYGIYYRDGKGTARGNLCSGNHNGGIGIAQSQSDVELVGNRCVGNGWRGITIVNEARAVLRDNVISENRGTGLVMEAAGTRIEAENNTLLDNGGSGLWIGPGVLYSGKNNDFTRNSEIAMSEPWRLLLENDFARLEAMARRLRTEQRYYSSGNWQLPDFYGALLRGVGTMGVPQEAEYLERIERWRKAFPESPTPLITLAWAYNEWAWRERGGGYIQEVTSEGWKGFDRYLKKGLAALEQAEALKEKDPDLYRAKFKTVMELGNSGGSRPSLGGALYSFVFGSSEDPGRQVFEKGVSLEPLYYPLYSARVRMLLPRWYGSARELEAFADEAAKRTSELAGETLYARVATEVFYFEDWDVFRSRYRFSWPRIKAGYEDILKQYPKSRYHRSWYALMACVYDDRESAAKVFEAIGDSWDTNAWGTDHRFLLWRKWALENGPNPRKDPLDRAVQADDPRAVRAAIAAGADPNGLNELGHTHLINALNSDHWAAAKALLEAGADVELPSVKGDIPIFSVLYEKSDEGLRLLLDHGVNLETRHPNGETPLILALQWNRPERAIALLEAGADPGATHQGYSPLHFAVIKGQANAVAALLQHKADPNVTNPRKRTPLHDAAQNGSLRICRLLLNHGAEVDLRAEDERTPAYDAADQGFLPVLKLLHENGADLTAHRVGHRTIIYAAANGGFNDIVEYILDRHPETLNEVTEAGFTLLHAASRKGFTETVRLLLDKGLDPSARTNDGETALSLAEKAGHTGTAALLRQSAGNQDQATGT